MRKEDCKTTNETSNGFTVSFPYLQRIFIRRDEEQFSRNCTVDLLVKELHIDRSFLVQSKEWIGLGMDDTVIESNIESIRKQNITSNNIEDIPF